MAILPNLPGLEATIKVNSSPLTEYVDNDADNDSGVGGAGGAVKTVIKYVEAVTGQEFSVCTRIDHSYICDSPSLTAEIWADGKWVAGEVFRTPGNIVSAPLKRTTYGATAWDDVEKSAILQHFKFSSINTTSDERKLTNIKNDIERMSKVGTIEVKFFRTSEPLTMTRDSGVLLASQNDATEIHEKAMKGDAKSHGISTGRTSEGNSRCSRVEYLDGRYSPIAVFAFRYRSMGRSFNSPSIALLTTFEEALKQLYIVRRTPSPAPANRAELRDRPQPVRNLKRERRDDDDDDNEKHGHIKRERGQPKVKKTKYRVTIDLTTDSDSDAGSIISLH